MEDQAEFWQTPNAKIAEDSQTHRSGARSDQLLLTGQAQQWATPNTPNGGRRLSKEDTLAKGATDKGKRQVPLEMQAEYFPTPQARDYKSESGGGKNSESLSEPRSDPAGDARTFELPDFAPGPNDRRWPAIITEYPELTPALSDFDRLLLVVGRAGLLPMGVERDPKRIGKALRKIIATRQIESQFHELVNGLAAQSGERTNSLRLTGNGVVPLQAAYAFITLARRLES